MISSTARLFSAWDTAIDKRTMLSSLAVLAHNELKCMTDWCLCWLNTEFLIPFRFQDRNCNIKVTRYLQVEEASFFHLPITCNGSSYYYYFFFDNAYKSAAETTLPYFLTVEQQPQSFTSPIVTCTHHSKIVPYAVFADAPHTPKSRHRQINPES